MSNLTRPGNPVVSYRQLKLVLKTRTLLKVHRPINSITPKMPKSAQKYIEEQYEPTQSLKGDKQKN